MVFPWFFYGFLWFFYGFSMDFYGFSMDFYGFSMDFYGLASSEKCFDPKTAYLLPVVVFFWFLPSKAPQAELFAPNTFGSRV